MSSLRSSKGYEKIKVLKISKGYKYKLSKDYKTCRLNGSPSEVSEIA
jgi:hypothetical protein